MKMKNHIVAHSVHLCTIYLTFIFSCRVSGRHKVCGQRYVEIITNQFKSLMFGQQSLKLHHLD